MNFIDKLERKLGKYAIKGLIRYFLVLYIIGAIIGLINSDIYYTYMALDIEKVLHGQVWRLFSFLIEPYGFTNFGAGTIIINALFFFFSCNVIMLFGTSLEEIWGSFKFNLYFFGGWLLSIIAAVIIYIFVGGGVYDSGFQYIYWAMFFAFATYYPDVQFAIMGIIPLKVKWLAYIDGAFLIYSIGKNIYYAVYGFRLGFSVTAIQYLSVAVAIAVSMLNFFIFFILYKKSSRMTFKQKKRKREYVKKTSQATNTTRHRCAICGRTEKDNPDLEFRFCSKCNGNFEYCSDHLFSHTHK